MGGKYEITGWNYPYKGHLDFSEFADSYWKARKIFNQAKKKYYCVSFTIRIQKNKFKGVGV
jgi:hypothetical protein